MMKFTKMHGCGNDYVYINCLEDKADDPAELARRVSDRHFGIGSDGLILICPSDRADVRMRMFNADGSEGEMCGNGIRCVAKYVYDHHIVEKTGLSVETGAGIKQLDLFTEQGKVVQVRVDMGEPVLAAAQIPVVSDKAEVIGVPVEVGGKTWEMTCVSMGNPHAVVFVQDTAGLDLISYGPLFEHHEMFPKRVNTEFVQVLSREEINMRVWERGSGETLACGTGSCAALVAANLCGLAGREAEIELDGGTLLDRWDEQTGRVLMTGPAAFVFDGEYEA